MSVVALVSAKGSPGVTTTALALAVVWPRPVLLVEADGAGGDLALWLNVSADAQLRLAAAGRHGISAETLAAYVEPVRQGVGDRWVLAAPAEAGKARRALSSLAAGGLPELLARMGVDVLVDAGRIDGAALLPLPHQVCVVCRPDLEQVAHAHGLVEELADADAGLMLVGHGEYTPAEVSTALGVPPLAVLPHDRRTATALRRGGRVSSRSPLLRTADHLARRLASPLPDEVEEAGPPSRVSETLTGAAS